MVISEKIIEPSNDIAKDSDEVKEIENKDLSQSEYIQVSVNESKE